MPSPFLETSGQASLISPTGKAVIGANAVVHASDVISLQTADLDLQGTLLADHSALNLKANTITFIPNGTSRPSGSGLYLTPSQWGNLETVFQNISLTSASDVIFNGSFDLPVKNSLTIDAARVMDLASGSAVTVEAPNITIQNTGTATPTPGTARTSQITLTAQEMQIGKGNILFDSFSSINLNAQNNLTFKGIGTLSTAGGDLNISTSRLTTSYYLEPVAPGLPAAGATNAALPALAPIYTAANFKIDAGSTGAVRIQPSGGTPGTSATPGGNLQIAGKTIDVSTLIEMPSGNLTLSASGSVFVRSGGQLVLPGTDYAPAVSSRCKAPTAARSVSMLGP